jgi:uncharacterized protein
MKFRVVLDTNIILSILSRRSEYKHILDKLFDNEYEAYITTEILLEYHEKITDFFDATTADIFTDALTTLPNVHKIEPYYHLNLIHADPDDNKFVDCAFAANAHYIVTNDKHFNVLKRISFPKISLLKIKEFGALLFNAPFA